MSTSNDSRTSRRNCHVLVVGAGLAGLEVAKELARRDVPDVVVLEGGPAEDLRHVNVAHPPATALRMWLRPDSDPYFRQPWSSRTPPCYTGSSGIRQRVGGRSLYWYGVSLRMEPWALAEPWWPTIVVSDLTTDRRGRRSFYGQVEHQLNEWRGPTAQPGRRRFDSLAGAPLLDVPLARRPGGAETERWYAYSPLDNWRDPVTGIPDASWDSGWLQSGMRVHRVVVRHGRARGVAVEDVRTGALLEITSDRVVLAAGTLENSRLAIQALSELGALPRPRLSGLCDHMVQGVFARLARPHAARLLNAIPPSTYYAPGSRSARSNLFLDLQPLADGSTLVDLQATGEQLPSTENFVTCDPAPEPSWPVAVHAAPRKADNDLLAGQRDTIQRAWDELCTIAECPRTSLRFDDFLFPRRTNELVLPENIHGLAVNCPLTWSGYLGTEDHEGGTLPLGRILGTDHQFVAIPGLFAAGPSTFPRMGAANPSLTTLALAHRLAAVLAGEIRP